MAGKKVLVLLCLVMVLILTACCAAGDERWASTDNRAGFWAGLWHGLIIIVTFAVSLFTKDVGIYETNNVGWGYNIGFILGCMISLGGGLRGATHHRKVKVTTRDPDWDKLSQRVEAGVQEGIKAAFADQEHPNHADWNEIGRRIKERIRERLRDWEKE
ncbi:MAG: hypothetical protein ABIL25_00545 [candidate division WOR-3 bacterium]